MSHFQLLLGLFAQFGGDFATICGWRRGGKMWQGLSGLCRFNNRLLKTSTGLAMWWALIGQARRLSDLCFNIEVFMSVSCNAKKTSLESWFGPFVGIYLHQKNVHVFLICYVTTFVFMFGNYTSGVNTLLTTLFRFICARNYQHLYRYGTYKASDFQS